MVELEIDFKKRRKAMRFKRHIERTHPSVRGKIKLENGLCPKKRKLGLARGTDKFINKMLINSPDFEEEARAVTEL